MNVESKISVLVFKGLRKDLPNSSQWVTSCYFCNKYINSGTPGYIHSSMLLNWLISFLEAKNLHKKGYKPEVNLEYVDDSGRAMNAKEAFRFLSHKFHGKGSGKLKTEKRHRKVLEDKLMEKMSSTDTPLNTLSKLQHKTKELATPYLVLSGNKNAMGGHTSLKK